MEKIHVNFKAPVKLIKLSCMNDNFLSHTVPINILSLSSKICGFNSERLAFICLHFLQSKIHHSKPCIIGYTYSKKQLKKKGQKVVYQKVVYSHKVVYQKFIKIKEKYPHPVIHHKVLGVFFFLITFYRKSRV